MATLYYRDLGRVEYLEAQALQERLADLRRRNLCPDTLLFVEHFHVYTLGRGGRRENVLTPGAIPVHRASRGGDVTYHGPGQLVVYPVIDLRSRLRKEVHRYLKNLELAAIDLLAEYGIEASRRPPYTGVWIGDRKIAAIGVAVRRGVTLHGLALNVDPDLAYFGAIVPCGLRWAGVTSMARELGTAPRGEEVKSRFLGCFARRFGYGETRAAPDDRFIAEPSPNAAARSA
ncbi:MAG TPA: lipoyl(octanoyl) transferase LipB [candidate division Zixibacteria bacterium]|nr:lipoyl(octanoyl) transferase LipB [candidate division Zixibacteria bacterium]